MVTAYYEMEGNRCCLCLRGHATGSQETCAAVSTLVNALDCVLSNDPSVKWYSHTVRPGYVDLHYNGGESAVNAMVFTAVGLHNTERERGDYISVTPGPDNQINIKTKEDTNGRVHDS